MASSEEKTYYELLTPVVCGNCECQDDVLSFCLQCHANICDKCKSIHCDANLTRYHIILHRTHPEVIKARRSKVYCSQHTGKEYVTYCMICSRPCCATCITEKHDGHKFADLENIISKTESEVDKLIETVETDFIPVTEHVISTMEEEINSYKTAVAMNKQYAKDTIQQLRQELDHEEKTLLALVDDHERKDLNYMESTKRHLEKTIEEVKSLVERGKTASADASLLFIKKELSKVDALRPNQITYPGNMCLKFSKYGFLPVFNFKSRVSNGGEKVLFDASSQLQHDTIQKENFDYQINAKVIKTIDKIEGRSVLHYDHHHVWICDSKEQYIDIYNDNFTKVKTIKTGCKCNDMAKYGSQDVIITDMHQILRIHNSNSISTFCNIYALALAGICVNNKQQIVVGAIAVEGTQEAWKIVVLSSYGSSIPQELENDQSGEPLFTGPINRVRQTVSGEYMVADSNWIKCLDIEWNVNWTYEFGIEVHALYCDKNNNTLVGDIDKNEIVILNKDGQLIRTWLTKKVCICTPLSMDVDSKGRLWIQQEKNVLISTYMDRERHEVPSS